MFHKFESLEHEKKWKDALEELKHLTLLYPDNSDVYIRAIYFLHNFLLEEKEWLKYVDVFTKELLNYFESWIVKFGEDRNFLFFIWKLLYIAERYFWLNDDGKKLSEKLAFKMQCKALKKEPDNKLFEWAICLSKNDIESTKILSLQIYNSDEYMNYLKTYWFPWLYVLRQIKAINEYD